jgi:hypothetical protein
LSRLFERPKAFWRQNQEGEVMNIIITKTNGPVGLEYLATGVDEKNKPINIGRDTMMAYGSTPQLAKEALKYRVDKAEGKARYELALLTDLQRAF